MMAGAEVKRANPIERFDGPCRVCRSQKGGRGAKKRIQGGIMVEGGFFSFFSLLFFFSVSFGNSLDVEGKDQTSFQW